MDGRYSLQVSALLWKSKIIIIKYISQVCISIFYSNDIFIVHIKDHSRIKCQIALKNFNIENPS